MSRDSGARRATESGQGMVDRLSGNTSKRHQVLKRYLISFLLIITVPMTVLLLFMSSSYHDSARKEQARINGERLSMMRNLVSFELKKIEPSAVMALDEAYLRPQFLSQSFHNYYLAVKTLKEIARSNTLVEMVIVYDKLNNIAVSNYGTTPLSYFGTEVWQTSLDNGKSLAEYIDGLENPSRAYGSMRITGLGMRRCIFLFYPSLASHLEDDMVMLYVIPVNNIPGLFSAGYDTDGSAFYLFDENREVLAHYGLELDDAVGTASDSQNGGVYKQQGEEYYYSVLDDAEFGWRFVNMLSLTRANQALSFRMQLFYWTFFAVLVVSALGLYLSLRLNYYPLLRLSKNLQSLAGGGGLSEEQTVNTAVRNLLLRLQEAQQHIQDVQPAAASFASQQLFLGKPLDDSLSALFNGESLPGTRNQEYIAAALVLKDGDDPESMRHQVESKGIRAFYLYGMSRERLMAVFQIEAGSEKQSYKTIAAAIRPLRGVISLGSAQRFEGVGRSFFEAELGLVFNSAAAAEDTARKASDILDSLQLLPHGFSSRHLAALSDSILRSDVASLAEFPDRWRETLAQVTLSAVECIQMSHDLFRTIVGAFDGHQAKREIIGKLMDYFYVIHPVMDKQRLSDAAAFFCATALFYVHGPLDEKKELINGILRFTDMNCTNANFTIQSVADEFNLSVSWLSRFFKDQMQVNLADYVKEKRIAFAEKLIMDGNMTMNEISQLLGYGNLSSFIRFFRSERGMTPVQFREWKAGEKK